MLFYCICCTGQSISKNKFIKFENKDSVFEAKLMLFLEEFITDLKEDRDTIRHVDKDHFEKNKIFFGFVSNYSESATYEDENFYQAQLLNCYPIADKTFKIQIGYLGSPDSSEPIVHTIFNLKAMETDAGFVFESHFEENLRSWHRRKLDNIVFRYEDSFDESRAWKFEKFNKEFAELNDVDPLQFEYIKGINPHHVLELFGIDYAVAYNGEVRGLGHATEDHFVSGINEEGYEHDLIHNYYGQINKGKETYRPWEEGICAYYAGSWGDSFAEMMTKFANFMDKNPETNLWEKYEEKFRIGKHDIRFLCNGLLVKKLVEEVGYSSIVDVLECGKKGEEYFKKLNNYIELDEHNFHSTIMDLLQNIQ